MSDDPLIELLILYLTTPSSNFYLSKLIQQSSSPVLEPLSIDNISLGNQSILGVKLSLKLQNAEVAGLSSIQIKETAGKPDIQVNGNRVTFEAQHPNTQSPPIGVPPILTINSGFIVTPESGPEITGTIVITVNAFSIQGVFSAASSDGHADKVIIDFKSLDMNTQATPDNININLKIHSAFSSFINQILKQPPILEKIVDGIKNKLNAENVLSSISQQATKAARSALSSSRLGK
ncbi:hypothetical protein MNBD_GAMMA09-3632 [hydrothermal vent metagenome]|uniref:Uncharacterized protein n=1 Tax=hydrothermal vent metagenome TaxID=652676 RepID=A0A3B0Y2K1_9ZZZZ